MRLIDSSSLVVMFSSEAETPTMAATSASCAEKEGSVSVKVMLSSPSAGSLVLSRGSSGKCAGTGWSRPGEAWATPLVLTPGPTGL